MKIQINKTTILLTTLMCLSLMSCREKTKPIVEGPTVTDIDGNKYKSVRIGKQIWMAENLRTTRFRNGAEIPYITSNQDWKEKTSSAQCTYENTTNPELIKKFGRLYNEYALLDTNIVAPLGWHIPTDKEWLELEDFVAFNSGNAASFGTALAGSSDWISTSRFGTTHLNLEETNTQKGFEINTLGFTALPTGIRDMFDGSFRSKGELSSMWSKSGRNYTIYSSTYHHRGRISYILDFYFRGINKKSLGTSIRCIKD